jgi:hypothetical protein
MIMIASSNPPKTTNFFMFLELLAGNLKMRKNTRIKLLAKSY